MLFGCTSSLIIDPVARCIVTPVKGGFVFGYLAGHTTDTCDIIVIDERKTMKLPPLSQEIHDDENQQDPMSSNKCE
jgi:hypothetical protein